MLYYSIQNRSHKIKTTRKKKKSNSKDIRIFRVHYKSILSSEKFTQIEIPDELKKELKLKCNYCPRPFKNALDIIRNFIIFITKTKKPRIIPILIHS